MEQTKRERMAARPAGSRRRDKTYSDTWAKREIKLGGQSYDDYLKSEEWQTIKATCRTRPFYQKCHICEATGRLDIHHTTYKYIHTKQPMRELVALCRECHDGVHQYAREKNCSVRIATLKYRPAIALNRVPIRTVGN